MMRGLVDTLERHHGVRILDEAVEESVRLSKRYITGRQLPDKSVSLLDTACARVNMSQSATPAAIEDRQRRIEQIDVQVEILKRETVTGGTHGETIAEREAEKLEVEAELAALKERWGAEKEKIAEIKELREKLEDAHGQETAGEQTAANEGAEPADADPPASPEEVADWKSELAVCMDELEELQGEEPLIYFCVDGQAIAEVVAAWTGIPVGRMVSDEIHQILNLKEKMGERIIGQGPRLGSHRPGHANLAGQADRSAQTDRRFPDGGHQRCGQDRNRAHLGRLALWRRAEHDRHQYDGVQGGA